jgi:cytochrome c peroxidase
MKGDKTYRECFKASFTDGTVSVENMLKDFRNLVMLTSSNSKFDHYRRNEAGGTLQVMKQLVMPF